MEFIFECWNSIQIDISRVSAQVLFCFKFMDVILIIGTYCNFSRALKTDQNLAYTSRCLKEEMSHKMCWIFTRHFQYGFRYAVNLKKIVNTSWKVLKICLRASERWLILSDYVRGCFENFLSLRRCFDLSVDKHKRAFSLVEKCRVISRPCP